MGSEEIPGLGLSRSVHAMSIQIHKFLDQHQARDFEADFLSLRDSRRYPEADLRPIVKRASQIWWQQQRHEIPLADLTALSRVVNAGHCLSANYVFTITKCGGMKAPSELKMLGSCKS